MVRRRDDDGLNVVTLEHLLVVVVRFDRAPDRVFHAIAVLVLALGEAIADRADLLFLAALLAIKQLADVSAAHPADANHADADDLVRLQQAACLRRVRVGLG